MLSTKRISKKKNNSTRKLKGGGVKNIGGSSGKEVLSATTFLTDPIDEDTMDKHFGPLGQRPDKRNLDVSEELVATDFNLSGPTAALSVAIRAAVGGGLLKESNTYSISENKRIKIYVKDSIETQTLSVLKMMHVLHNKEKQSHNDKRPFDEKNGTYYFCLLYTSPSPRDRTRSRMPSSA